MTITRVLTFRMLKVQQLKRARAFKRTLQVPDVAVHLAQFSICTLERLDSRNLRNHDAVSETFRNLLRDVHRARLPACPFPYRPVGHRDLNLLTWLCCSVHEAELRNKNMRGCTPLTHSSYSAFNWSNILMRWSKNSGLGLSCTDG